MIDLTKNYHPLFSPEEGDSDFEPEAFARIEVKRLECNGPLRNVEKSGTRCMRFFRPEELEAPEQFQREFGGGSYEVGARRADGTYYKQRWIQAPGDSKVMPGTETGAVFAPTAGPTAGANGVPMPPGIDPNMAYWMQMQELQRQRDEARQERERQREREERDRQETRDANNRQSLIALAGILVPALLPKGDSQADTIKALAEWQKANQPAAPAQTGAQAVRDAVGLVKDLKDLDLGQEKAEPPEKMSELLSIGLQGLQALVSMKNAAPVVAAVQTAPGTAASVVETVLGG